MSKFADWRVISEKADGKEDNNGSINLDTSNINRENNSLTANGITLDDLKEISTALSSGAKDFRKLRSVAKHVNEGKSLDTKEDLADSLLEGKANKLQKSDLKWAVSNTHTKPETKVEAAKAKPSLSKEDHSLFQNLVDSVTYSDKSLYRENGKATIANMDNFTSEDWRRIREKMNKVEESKKHLPEVSILCESEHSCETDESKIENSDKNLESVSIKKTEEGIITEDRLHDIKTTTKDGVTRAEVGEDTTVTRDANEGTTTYEVDGQKLYEQTKDGTRTITLDNGADIEIATTDDGAEIIQEGKVIATIRREYTWQECSEGVFASIKNASSAEEALEILKQYKDIDGINKDIILARTGGATLIRDGKLVADFEHNESGELLEARFYLSQSKQLVRTNKGELLIREPNKEDVALNDNQLQFIINNLGDNSKFIARALRSLQNGSSVNLGNDVSINVNRAIRGQMGTERQGTRTPFRFRIFGDQVETEDGQGNEIKRNNTTGDTDLKTASNKTASIKPTETTFNVKTEQLELKDGVVTFENSDVVINKDGSYTLPNGTTVNTDSSVRLVDGTEITAEGWVRKDASSKVNLELNQPSEKSLEIYNSFAKSIAKSVASRVKGGAVSLSDIALLRANLSILTNYIGFFTNIGNLEVVNTLNSSWALVKASLDEAEPTVRRKQELQEYIRVGSRKEKN